MYLRKLIIYLRLYGVYLLVDWRICAKIEASDVSATLNEFRWKRVEDIRAEIAQTRGEEPWQISYTIILWHLRTLVRQGVVETGLTEVKTGKYKGCLELVYRLSSEDGEPELSYDLIFHPAAWNFLPA